MDRPAPAHALQEYNGSGDPGTAGLNVFTLLTWPADWIDTRTLSVENVASDAILDDEVRAEITALPNYRYRCAAHWSNGRAT